MYISSKYEEVIPLLMKTILNKIGHDKFSLSSVQEKEIEMIKKALEKYQFDAALGGARRDEEKSRAKERVCSFRSAQHRWDPKQQRPDITRLDSRLARVVRCGRQINHPAGSRSPTKQAPSSYGPVCEAASKLSALLDSEPWR